MEQTAAMTPVSPHTKQELMELAQAWVDAAVEYALVGGVSACELRSGAHAAFREALFATIAPSAECADARNRKPFDTARGAPQPDAGAMAEAENAERVRQAVKWLRRTARGYRRNGETDSLVRAQWEKAAKRADEIATLIEGLVK
jgi:hypothetical protein